MVKSKESRIARQSKRNASEIQKFYMDRRKSITDLFQSMLADFVNLNPLYRDVDMARDLKTITNRFKDEGLGLLSVTLPQLMQDLFCYIEGGTPSYDGWKKQTRAEYPAFLGRLFGEVYTKGQYAEMSFGQIYQICVAFKKLDGPYRESSLRKTLRSFVEVDECIGKIDFNSDVLKPIIADASKLIERLFESMSDRYLKGFFKPRPGPGATNTPVDKALRFRPHVLYEQLNEEFDYLQWFHYHSWDPIEDARQYMNLPVRGFAESRFKFVPKYLFKPRGICIEENEMQFFQQSIKGFLYLWIEEHPLTRGKVNFRQQSINRNHALAASVNGDFATIDMSDASDRVGRELVHRLFLRTALLEPLDAVSTRHIKLPDGKLHLAHKFAPMGSGVCFPVMALVHWALISSIIRLSSIPDSEKVSKQVYVYGDDIVLPTAACEAVFTYLPLFGMKLNKTKSFSQGLFRESCGIHAYGGVDVTPVYVNYVTHKYQEKSDTRVLLSLIAKESAFFKKGMTETSQCIQKLIRDVYGLLPLVGEASPLLGYKRSGRTNLCDVLRHSRRTRYNADHQTFVYSMQVVRPLIGQPLRMTEGEGYLRKLLTSADEASTFPGDVSDHVIRRQWISMQAM